MGDLGTVFNTLSTPSLASSSDVSHLPFLFKNVKNIPRSSTRDFCVSAYRPLQRRVPSVALTRLTSNPIEAGLLTPTGPPSLSSYLVTHPVTPPPPPAFH